MMYFLMLKLSELIMNPTVVQDLQQVLKWPFPLLVHLMISFLHQGC